MTYLTRLLLEVKPNWLKSPVQEFKYDLRGIRLGFGSSVFAPTAINVARGWSMDFTFGTAQEFSDFQDFTGSLYGRLEGFWFPNLVLQWEVVTGVSATVFEIATQNLADTWSADASAHLYFIRPDGTTDAVEILTVSNPSAGVDRITTVTPLGGTPDSTWRFYRLLYVRLADDNERAKAHCEGVYTQELKIVELPEEYAAAETGQAPIYLYDFYQDNGDTTTYHWRYTSFARAVVSSGDTFNALNITHGSLKQSTKADRSEISIDTTFDASAPWALQLPFPSTRPLRLNLYEVDATLPSIRTLYFAGECSDIHLDGTDVSLSFDHWFDSLRQQLPGRSIQSRCHHHLFDPLTCKAVAASYVDPDFALSATIVSISGVVVGITHAKFTSDPSDYPINFFAGGKIRTGVEPTIEERLIVASSAASGGGVSLSLSQRIVHQTAPIAATVQRGCDRYYETCRDDFANEVNFPGFVDVPRVNPTFKAMEIASGTSGKK